METEIVKHEQQQLQTTSGDDFVKLIQWALVNPEVDPAKVSALYDLKMKAEAERQRVAFVAALAKVSDQLPEIDRNGQSHHGKYSRLIDVYRAIKPIIAKEGFSTSYNSVPRDGKVSVTLKVVHCEGHSESISIDLPIDNSGSKNGAQAIISTVSYGRRALTVMFFDLVQSDGKDDDDGNGGSAPITEEQTRDLNALLEETKGALEFPVHLGRFLKLYKISKLSELLARDLPAALKAIEEKRRAQK